MNCGAECGRGVDLRGDLPSGCLLSLPHVTMRGRLGVSEDGETGAGERFIGGVSDSFGLAGEGVSAASSSLWLSSDIEKRGCSGLHE